MSECYLECESDSDPVACDNCDWEGEASEMEIIRDIEQRINPGCIVPAGQCPECGCLAYLTKPPQWSAQATIKAIEEVTYIGYALTGGV